MKTWLSDLQVQRESLDIYSPNKQSRAVSWVPRWQQGSRDTTRTGWCFHPSPASVAISDPGRSNHDQAMVTVTMLKPSFSDHSHRMLADPLLPNMGKRGDVRLVFLAHTPPPRPLASPTEETKGVRLHQGTFVSEANRTGKG